MPHKMNTRSCERINGFMTILRGYQTMVAELAGAQWNEGDVFVFRCASGCAPGRVLHHRRPLRDLPDRPGRVRGISRR